jgi:hypothetical protein
MLMTCREMTSKHTEFSEGTLTFWDRLRARLHLRLCHACRTYDDQMRRTTASLRNLDRAPPEDLVAKLREELRLHRGRSLENPAGRSG